MPAQAMTFQQALLQKLTLKQTLLLRTIHLWILLRLVLTQLSSRTLLMLRLSSHSRQQVQSRQSLKCFRKRFSQLARISRFVVLSVWKVLVLLMYTQAVRLVFSLTLIQTSLQSRSLLHTARMLQCRLQLLTLLTSMRVKFLQKSSSMRKKLCVSR